MKKNLFFTFVSACVPGCGQMYQGYMRRGFSLALWFCTVIFIATSLNFGVIALFLPVIWAFAFYDTFNIRSMEADQLAAFPDDFLPSRTLMQQYNLDNLIKQDTPRKVIGWGAILLGVLLLFNTILRPIYWQLIEIYPLFARLVDGIVPATLGVIIIVLGVRMLRSSSKKTNTSSSDTIKEGDIGDE